jgi:hypothetical protein
LFAQDPLTTDAERIQNIVESKYCPADLNKIATECHLLDDDQQETLHKLLRKFAHLFDGTVESYLSCNGYRSMYSRLLSSRLEEAPNLASPFTQECF